MESDNIGCVCPIFFVNVLLSVFISIVSLSSPFSGFLMSKTKDTNFFTVDALLVNHYSFIHKTGITKVLLKK